MPSGSDQSYRLPPGAQVVDDDGDQIPDSVGIDPDGDGKTNFTAPVIQFRGERFVYLGSTRPRSIRQLFSDAAIESTWRMRALAVLVFALIVGFWAGWMTRGWWYPSGTTPVAVPELPESKLAVEIEDAVRGAPMSWIAGLDPKEQRKLLEAWRADRDARARWKEKHERDSSLPREGRD